MTMYRWTIVLTAVCALVMVGSARATMLSVNDVVIASDNYEGDTVGGSIVATWEHGLSRLAATAYSRS